MTDAPDRDLLQQLWGELDGRAEQTAEVELVGTLGALPSVYDVSAWASGSVAVATLAISQLQALRSERPARHVVVDRRHAAAAFRSERYLAGVGFGLPPVWDPIAGDYEARDGFVRLHTNYPNHRRAVVHVLAGAADRAAVSAAVAGFGAQELEQAVVDAGGCAAACRSAASWRSHPQGRALAHAPLFELTRRRVAPALGFAQRGTRVSVAQAPLAGVRVLDLTRVLAGPVCTRLLAAYGAEVLRVDPPGFEELEPLLGDSTWGKLRCRIDLRSAEGRARFEQLLSTADVLVHGYRADALARLGFGTERRLALNPRLIDVSLNAYGFHGPWAERRGFDSLVQMSCGIAAHAQALLGAPRPVPLPAQALDHGAGYLLAAATARALARLLECGEASSVRLSLAGCAERLIALGDQHDPHSPELTEQEVARYCEEVESSLGRLRRVRPPGAIDAVSGIALRAPGKLGSDPAAWQGAD